MPRGSTIAADLDSGDPSISGAGHAVDAERTLGRNVVAVERLVNSAVRPHRSSLIPRALLPIARLVMVGHDHLDEVLRLFHAVPPGDQDAERETVVGRECGARRTHLVGQPCSLVHGYAKRD